MKVSPINNKSINFGAKIEYNSFVEKGFDLAKKSTDSARMKDLNFSKEFIDSVSTILNDGKKKTVEFNRPGCPEILVGKQGIIRNPQEGYESVYMINSYAASLENKPEKSGLDKKMDELKKRIEYTSVLLEELKADYAKCLREKLEYLQETIKKNI